MLAAPPLTSSSTADSGRGQRRVAPVVDLLRCCCLCPHAENYFSTDLRKEKGAGGLLGVCGNFNLCVLCHGEEVTHEDKTCVQMKIALHPPVALASTLPFRLK